MTGELTQRLSQANLARQQGQQMLKAGARPTTVMQLFSYDTFRVELPALEPPASRYTCRWARR